MSVKNGGLSFGMFAVIWLLLMILWLGSDFLAEYKKNNMTEQDKAELVLQQKTEAAIKEREANDEQRLISSSFKDVKGDEVPLWVLAKLMNSDVAKIVLIFVLVAGFGVWYKNKEMNKY